MTTIESVKTASIGELLAFYNEFVPPGNLKKFKSREVAETRVTKLLEEQASRKGDYTVVSVHEVNVAPKTVTETAPTVKRARVQSPEKIAASLKYQADLAANAAERKADREARVAAKRAADEAKKNAPPVAKGPKPYAKPARPEIIRAVTAGTRVARLIDLLSRPQGATEVEIKAIGIANSARSWLAYDLNTVVGYGFESKDGVNFHLVMPTGMESHLPHKVKIVVEKKAEEVEQSKAA
jgi:hypothetical protein